MEGALGTKMGSDVLVELPEVLDIRAAALLHGDLLALRGKQVVLDASRVRRLGGQCLQVLLSAAMTWRADSTALAVVNASGDFEAGLARLGVSLAVINAPEELQ